MVVINRFKKVMSVNEIACFSNASVKEIHIEFFFRFEQR